MSTRYFVICDDCVKSISAADRSFRGVALTPEAKKGLAKFIIDHYDHNVKIISEYEYYGID